MTAPQNPTTCAQLRQQWSPPPFAKPVGQAWQQGIGGIQDAQSQRAQYGVLARFPSKAPVDALAKIGIDRNLSPTFGDNATQDAFRLWLKSAFTTQALSSPTPIDPVRPGWYYGGTDVGIRAAFVNSGFWADEAGTCAGPKIYTNRDLVSRSGTGTGIVTCASSIVAPSPNVRWSPDTAMHSIVVTITHDGTAGAADSGELTVAIDSGMAQTYSPIPLQIIKAAPAGGASIQLAFAGDFVSGAQYAPSPPDHVTGRWARAWLALPSDNFFGLPRLWGDGAGGFDGEWGHGPDDTDPPESWGDGPWATGSSLYALIGSLARAWFPGHVLFVGAWMVAGTDMQIDPLPTGIWSEESDVTFSGEHMPFWRFGSGR